MPKKSFNKALQRARDAKPADAPAPAPEAVADTPPPQDPVTSGEQAPAAPPEDLDKVDRKQDPLTAGEETSKMDKWMQRVSQNKVGGGDDDDSGEEIEFSSPVSESPTPGMTPPEGGKRVGSWMDRVSQAKSPANSPRASPAREEAAPEPMPAAPQHAAAAPKASKLDRWKTRVAANPVAPAPATAAPQGNDAAQGAGDGVSKLEQWRQRRAKKETEANGAVAPPAPSAAQAAEGGSGKGTERPHSGGALGEWLGGVTTGLTENLITQPLAGIKSLGGLFQGKTPEGPKKKAAKVPRSPPPLLSPRPVRPLLMTVTSVRGPNLDVSLAATPPLFSCRSATLVPRDSGMAWDRPTPGQTGCRTEVGSVGILSGKKTMYPCRWRWRLSRGCVEARSWMACPRQTSRGSHPSEPLSSEYGTLIRQSRPDSGLGFQVKFLETWQGVSSLLGSDAARCCLSLPRKL